MGVLLMSLQSTKYYLKTIIIVEYIYYLILYGLKLLKDKKYMKIKVCLSLIFGFILLSGTVYAWDISAQFTTTDYEYNSNQLQIFGNVAKDGETYYADLNASDNTYTTSNRYCSYDGKYRYYPDAWDIERKYINSNKYKILVRGRSDADCGKGQPQNAGWIKSNPDSDWKITKVVKCSINSDTYSSNNVLIDTYCNVNKTIGKIEWQSGSGCGGCCLCPDGAGVDIDIVVEKNITPISRTYCGDGTCNGKETPETCSKDCKYYCKDSDGGINYYKKGIVSRCYIREGKKICEAIKPKDFCLQLGGNMLEHYCEKGGGKIESKTYTCPNGCEDGACIRNETRSLKLYRGWNMISSPVTRPISVSEIEKTCELVPYKDYKVWYWDTTIDEWSHPTVLELGKGYYVKVNVDCIVNITGKKFEFERQKIYKGWNMISPGETNLEQILGACEDHLVPYEGYKVWKWNPKTDSWEHPTKFELGQGYYIKSDADCDLSKKVEIPFPNR